MRVYVRFLLALYVVGLLLAMALRVTLRLWWIDPATGLYLREPLAELLVHVFNVIIAAVPIILFAASRLKRVDDDYALFVENQISNILALLTGGTLLAFTTLGRPTVWIEQGFSPRTLEIMGYVNLILGVLAALAFLYLGVSGILGRKKPPLGLVLIFPPLWQMAALVTRFNSYTTVTAISDHLMAVLFMGFSGLFLIGQARTLCGHMRKDGRNYAIPSGLCCAMFGLLLVLPNLVYMAVNRQITTPTPMLGVYECAYVLCQSVYTLVFTVRLTRSIRKV